MGLKLTHKQRLVATIGISFAFFVAEIVVAFMTKSLALLADAFHYVRRDPSTKETPANRSDERPHWVYCGFGCGHYL